MVQVDRYVRSLLSLLQRRYVEWDERHPSAADMRRPLPQAALRRAVGLNGLAVPIEDEDWPQRTFAERAIHTLFSSPFYPLWDDPQTWASNDEAVATLREVLTDRVIPHEVTPWGELQSDAVQSDFAFRGIGALYLARSPGPEPFVVDVTWMADCEVRDDYERYGAAAYFDADRRIVRIWWSHGDKDVYPGDPDWEHVKFAWRSSVGVGATVADHLWCLHMQIANEMVIAAREALPADHPLRLFLKPYHYRTIAINHAALTLLLVKRGLTHRAFGFTPEGLAAAALHGEGRFKLEPFRRSLEKQGTADLSDFPFAEDGLALAAVFHDYVTSYVALFYPTHASVSEDADLQAWWARLANTRPDDRTLATREQLVEAVSGFLFHVVGMHRFVGAMREYTLDPDRMGGRIRPGAIRSDVQASFLGMLLIAATGLDQPKLLSDFSHLLPADRAAEAHALLEAHMAKLRDLSAEIDRKNQGRPRPFNYFNPAILDCSVSI